MNDQQYIMSIDEGTTSTRAILFNNDGDIVGKAHGSSTSIFQNLVGLNTMPMRFGMPFNQ